MVLCADRAAKPKPHPAMLLAIVRRLNVRKQEALYVGDMTIDVQTGIRAGIQTIAVTTGSSTKRELKALKPYRIIHKIEEVKKILEERKL